MLTSLFAAEEDALAIEGVGMKISRSRDLGTTKRVRHECN